MKIKRKFNVVGSAFGHGAQICTTNEAPQYLSSVYNLMDKLGSHFHWYSIIDNRNIMGDKNERT